MFLSKEKPLRRFEDWKIGRLEERGIFI